MLMDGISQRLNCYPSSRRSWVKLKDNHSTSKDEMGSKCLIFVIDCSTSSLSCCSLFAIQAVLSLLIFILRVTPLCALCQDQGRWSLNNEHNVIVLPSP